MESPVIVFSCTRVVWLYFVLVCVARGAWPCSVVFDNSAGSQDFVRVCFGERAVALLVNGYTRLLMRVVLSVSSCNTFRVDCVRFAIKCCGNCR